MYFEFIQRQSQVYQNTYQHIGTHQDKPKDRKKTKDMYPLLVNPNQIFEYYLDKGLIKQIQGKEYGPNDEKPHQQRQNQFCQYHQIKGHNTIGCCYILRKKLKHLLDSGIFSYENDVLKVKNQDLPFINMVNMIIYDYNSKPIEFDDEFSIMSM